MKYRIFYAALIVAFSSSVVVADETRENRHDSEINQIKISKQLNAQNIAANKTAIAAIQLKAGPAGANGVDGATGAQGPIGLTGVAGANGVDGATGAQGPIGLTGPAGANGVDGATGAQGPIGLTGAAGANGVDGATGAQGPIGLTGPAGANGVDGATGAQGPIGLTGPAGPQGPAGSVGADGAVGPQGPAGSVQGMAFVKFKCAANSSPLIQGNNLLCLNTISQQSPLANTAIQQSALVQDGIELLKVGIYEITTTAAIIAGLGGTAYMDILADNIPVSRVQAYYSNQVWKSLHQSTYIYVTTPGTIVTSMITMNASTGTVWHLSENTSLQVMYLGAGN